VALVVKNEKILTNPHVFVTRIVVSVTRNAVSVTRIVVFVTKTDDGAIKRW
jgi:hypothetical protein